VVVIKNPLSEWRVARQRLDLRRLLTQGFLRRVREGSGRTEALYTRI
jgi:hypothetical protein